MLWNILITILIGALVGWIAGKLMDVNGGFWFRVLLGVIGSAVGRLLAGLLGISAKTVSIGGILISVAGACIVIWAVRAIKGKKK